VNNNWINSINSVNTITEDLKSRIVARVAETVTYEFKPKEG